MLTLSNLFFQILSLVNIFYFLNTNQTNTFILRGTFENKKVLDIIIFIPLKFKNLLKDNTIHIQVCSNN